MNESKKKILYVEDHVEMCELISIDLPEYEVINAYTTADALNKAMVDRFDLYLVDFYLPDGSGLELCRHIHALAPDIPIILCSGAALLTTGQIETAGVQRFIHKDTNFLWQLRAAVAQVLSEPG